MAPGLSRSACVDPARGSASRSFAQHAGAEAQAAADVRQVGPTTPSAVGAADRVAGAAAVGEEELAARGGACARSARRRAPPAARASASNSLAARSPRRRSHSACEAPQYSAQTPRKTPVRVGSSASRVTRPGIMSILPPSDGIQNEWMTSGLSSGTRRLAHRQADLVGELERGDLAAAAGSARATTTARPRPRSQAARRRRREELGHQASP